MTTIDHIPNDVLASIIKSAGPSRDVQCVSKRFSELTGEVALETFNRLSNAEMADDEFYLLRHVFQEVKAEFPLAETVGDVAVRALDTLYKRLEPHYPNKTFEEIHTALNRDFLSQFEKECQEESLIEFASILEENFYTGSLCTSFETTQERLNHIRTWLRQNNASIGRLPWLELSSEKLTRLPSEIRHFSQLRGLVISRTSITFLPNKLWQLQNVISLRVENSPLEFFDVPDGNVSPLFQIFLSNTKLKKYPKCVERFARTVQKLSLNGSGIKSLPESIRNLTNLREFNILNNPLKNLPTSIGTLAYLDKLEADWKNIPTLCDEIVYESLRNIRRMPEIYAYRPYGPVINFLWPVLEPLIYLVGGTLLITVCFIISLIITAILAVIGALILTVCSISVSAQLSFILLTTTLVIIEIVIAIFILNHFHL